MRWMNKSNKIKKHWAKLAAKRKSRKEKQMDRLMKRIEKKETEARQEDADAEKYGKTKRGRNRARDWYGK